MSHPELLPETEPVSGYWECDAISLQFSLGSAQTLSALSCLSVGTPMSWMEILHEEGKSTALMTLRRAAKDRLPFSFEAQLRTALDTKKWVRVVGDSANPTQLRGFITEASSMKIEPTMRKSVRRPDLTGELHAAEVRHRELFERVPFPVICYEWGSMRIVDVNQKAVTEYGYTKEEFCEMEVQDLWPADLVEQFRRNVQQIDPLKPASFNSVHTRKDGSRLDVRLSSYAVPLKDQALRVMVTQNQTDAHRVEQDLRVSNERLSFIAKVTGAVVGTLSLPDQARDMAEQVRDAFKVDACVIRLMKGDALELLASTGIAPELLVQRMPFVLGLPAKVIREGKALAIDDVRLSGDWPPMDSAVFSQYPFVSYAGAPLIAKDRIIGVLGIFCDKEVRSFNDADLAHLQIVANNMAIAVLNNELYAQLNEHRATLQANEERLRLVTEASTDGIWEWDRATDTFSWSDRIYHLLEVVPTAMAPQRANTLEIVHPEDRRSFLLTLIRSSRERSALRCEVRLKRGEGTYGHYQVYGKFVFDKNQQIVRMVGSVHDITERVQRDRELEAVAAISLALREVETTQEMLPMISDQIAQTLGLESLGVALVDPGSDSVIIRHASGDFSDVVGARFKRNEGFIGRVFADAKVKFSPDFRDEYASILKSVLPGPTAVLGVPLVARGEVIGVLWLGKASEPGCANAAFNPGEARLLSILAEIAAASLRRAGLRERTEFHLRRLNSLSIIHATVSENRDLKQTLSTLLQELQSQTGIDAATISVADGKESSLRLETSVGFQNHVLIPAFSQDFIAQKKAGKLSSFLDTSPQGRRIAKWIALGYCSYIAMPLVANEQTVGLLEIFHRGEFPQNVDLDNFVEMLASQAAIAVDNTMLLKSLRSANSELTAAYDATIEGWARALDLRDHETEGHTRRVTEMTVALAKLMGVPEQEIAHMRRGALLHDIGKMAIPDRVLLKPGELDQTEWIVMRRHPGIALDLLEPISFLKPAIDIPFCHHEKWDGSGYPRRLKGKEIPLSARIFSVIDVWDALRSDRPYRKGWSAEQAVNFIRVQSGKHFDPEVVEVFIANREQIDRCCR